MEQLETERWSSYRRRDGAVRDGEDGAVRDGEMEQLETERWSSIDER